MSFKEKRRWFREYFFGDWRLILKNLNSSSSLSPQEKREACRDLKRLAHTFRKPDLFFDPTQSNIASCFYWDRTPQGPIYWGTLARTLEDDKDRNRSDQEKPL